MRSGPLRVSETHGERWELALEQLEAGRSAVIVEREVTLGLQRHTGWPGADERVHISVYTTTEPARITQSVMDADGQLGLRLLADLRDADDRLDRLLADTGFDVEYVYDYGTGGVTIGTVDEEGKVTPS